MFVLGAFQVGEDLIPVVLEDGVFPYTLYKGVVFGVGWDSDCGYGFSGLGHVCPDGVIAGEGVACSVSFFKDEVAFVHGDTGPG